MPVTSKRQPLGQRLPEFPWDTIAEVKAKAAAHPDGIIDLSVGTPVDDVAPSIQLALVEHAAEPGYPQTVGTPELREAIVGAMARRFAVTGLDERSVLPVIGTKEAIAWLPTLLGLAGQKVIIPELAYPTYEVGALLAGAEPVRSDTPVEGAALAFINSPSNPSGRVMSVAEMREWVEFSRDTGAIIASDECYLGLPWSAEPVSILDPRVCGEDMTGLLALHSLSKTSNLASYRAGAGSRAIQTWCRSSCSCASIPGSWCPGPCSTPCGPRLSTTRMSSSKPPPTRSDAPRCSLRSWTAVSPSTILRPACTCGRAARAWVRATHSTGSLSAGSWPLRATSTDRRGSSTCALGSLPRTRVSTLRWRACRTNSARRSFRVFLSQTATY